MNVTEMVKRNEAFTFNGFEGILATPGEKLPMLELVNSQLWSGEELTKFVSQMWDMTMVITHNGVVIGWKTFDGKLHILDSVSREEFEALTGF